jgi:hypothetical protein
MLSRVARLYNYLKTKSPNFVIHNLSLGLIDLVYFMTFWYFMANFYNKLKVIICYNLDICYIVWSFGIYFPVLVYCTKKNLATLMLTCKIFGLFYPPFLSSV